VTHPTGPAGAPSGPGGHRGFVVTARTSAPVDAVWPLLGEARPWKEWTFLDRSELEREGATDPDGVGAVRRFTRLGFGSREEVVAWEPPSHLGYVMRSGFPVRNYRADVRLQPDGEGTAVSWSVRFDERVPLTGRLMEALLHRIVSGFARGLVRHTERASASSPP